MSRILRFGVMGSGMSGVLLASKVSIVGPLSVSFYHVEGDSGNADRERRRLIESENRRR